MIYDDYFSLAKNLKKEGRLLALDVGKKIIGVAISDALKMISNPKSAIIRRGSKSDFVEIKKIISDNSVEALIIGLPLNMNGSESEMSGFVRRFADNLDSFLGDYKITFFDERLTSFAAEDLIKRKVKLRKVKEKNLVDQIAASLILQSFLDELEHYNF